MIARLSVLVLLGIGAGCQSSLLPRDGTASLSVEVMRGFAVPSRPLQSEARRWAVLLDATESMTQPLPTGPMRLAVARAEAEDLVRTLPDAARVELRAVGSRAGAGACDAGEEITSSPAGDDRLGLLQQLGSLRPTGPGSMVAELEALGRVLAGSADASATRIAVFSDLDDACGRDVCAAARSVVDTGAWLEWYYVGDEDPPGCLAELRPAPSAPGPIASQLTDKEPAFRVVHGSGTPEALSGAPVIATGIAGRGSIELPAGEVLVVVELDPPEWVGPLALRPGENVRLRLLDFPMALPPQRAWQVERDGEDYLSTLPELPGIPR